MSRIPKLAWLLSSLCSLSACDEYMYVTLEEHSVVQGYSNGLFGLGPGPVTLAGNIVGLWQRPIGIAHAVAGGKKTVYVSDFGADRITLLAVNSLTGQLTPLPDVVSTGKNPLYIAIHPSNRFLYVTNNGSDDVSIYTITPTGDLSPFASGSGLITAGKSPRGIAVNEQFAYVANSGSDNVSEYRIDEGGVLQEITPHSPVKSGRNPQTVAIHPNGRFVYVTNMQDYTVSQYTVNTAGAPPFGTLVPMQPPFVGAGKEPVAVAVHPSGRFAYVANALDDSISIYTVDANTGALTKAMFDIALAMGQTPNDLVIDPGGTSLYVACQFNNMIERHSIDPQSGNLPQLEWTVVTTPVHTPWQLTIVP